ncbi:hypothetical protein ABL78_3959 [Leptomonas seymouri]|uniref:Uncharacterized protein n=1 Tax=Leptomonas seymouri TaxID=5684 RepID=A0A0N1IKM5_LEPSE|nr:hypothetical protein ABL78_3959 [Leptomonas seymouri]|eukprot:KPI86968.1 hypothetical protein ABL78_3959 [Leptomonas seymouri]
MPSTDLSFYVLPTGIGEEDVFARGEAPVLLAAVAGTGRALPPAVGAATAGPPTTFELARSEKPAQHIHFADPPASTTNSGFPLPTQSSQGTAHGAVISLTSSPAPATPATSASPTLPSAEPLCRLHYMVTSYLCTLQRGTALARRLPSSPREVASQRSFISPFGGAVQLAGGQHCYYACPLEEGRYLATVCLPRSVWQQLGGGDGAAYAHCLFHTTLLCTALSPSAFQKGGNAQSACYASLHTRLTSNPQVVQQCMSARVSAIAHLCHQIASHPHRYAPRVAALRRLCREDVSPLRTHPRLGQRVEELLRSATSSTCPASLRGMMPTMGLNSPEKRYVLAAVSLWYRGHPLHTSLMSSDQQQQSITAPLHSRGAQLRSAALSVMLKELEKRGRLGEDVSYQGANSTPVSVTAQCFCVSWSSYNASQAHTTASGYVSQPTWASPAPGSAQRPCAMSMAFTSSSGWTIALLLQPMRTPYVGSPLSIIFNGVHGLMTDDFESDGFFSLVREATAATRNTWRRPVHLVSPLAAQLETAVIAIKVGRRLPGTAATQDKVLYFLDVKASEAAIRLALKEASSTSSAAHCALPFASLHLTDSQYNVDKKRKASLIASHAETQRRRNLSDADGFLHYAVQATNSADASSTSSASLSRSVEAAVQAAMSYVHLTARIQKCIQRHKKGVRPALPSGGASPLPLLRHQRSQAAFSVVAEADTVRLVKAVPCHCSSGTSLMSSKAQHAVVYVVVELEKKKVPAAAHGALRSFASWILARCV